MSKKIYITTTLPYVNSDPHIGFALEIVQADVLARYYRKEGYDVFFNTGTDEHGLKIFQSALKQKMDPQEYCNIYAQKNRALKEALNLSYNSFVRTTDDYHIKAAQEFWRRCYKNGDIYKKNYKAKYCVGCELEKRDSELVNGRCPLHPQRELEIIEEENYFFRYSKYQKALLEFYEKHPDFVVPSSRFKEIKEFTKRGLEDFSVSRLKKKMPWGIPVPGDEDHVMYVWFDALVNYISALGWPFNLKKFNEFWPGLQLAGKDNLRQQSSMWQAMLLSAGLSPSKQIFIHGFITANGQKMSKSLGNFIDPFELVEKYGTDAVRYYLLREISPTEDSDFTYQKFEARYNSDLACGLGNLLARCCGLRESKTEPRPRRETILKIKKIREDYKKAIENFKFNEALTHIWGLVDDCDHCISKERLWEKKDKEIINDLFYILNAISDLLEPFLPQTSQQIKDTVIKGGKTILFPRLF